MEEQEIKELEQDEEQGDRDMVEQLRKVDQLWEVGKTKQRSSKTAKVTLGSSKAKRSSMEPRLEEKPSKRRKFALVEKGWGTKTTVLGEKNPNNIERELEILTDEQEAIETK